MTDDLCRISEISSKHMRVQNIAHLIDEKSLKRIHVTMDGKKARRRWDKQDRVPEESE